MTWRNRSGLPFEWENDELNGECDITREEIVQVHNLPAQMPGIDLESDTATDIDTRDPVLPETSEEHAHTAAANADIANYKTPDITGVTTAVDLLDDHGLQEGDTNPNTKTIEVEDDVDSDEETLAPDSDDDDDDTPGSTIDTNAGTTTRSRKPPRRLQFNFNNKRYVDQETDGVIHFNMDSPDHDKPLSEEDAMVHILGVIMIQQFSIKKGLKQFEDRGEKSIMKELQQHHEHADVYVRSNMVNFSIYRLEVPIYRLTNFLPIYRLKKKSFSIYRLAR